MKEVLSKYEWQMMILALESNLDNQRYDRNEIERNIDALSRGYTKDYYRLLNTCDEMSLNDQELIYRILEMFRGLNFSINNIRRENPRIMELDEIEYRAIFNGFDLSNPEETYMIDITDYIFKDGKYKELHDNFYNHDNGNSHSEKLPHYLRMLEKFESIDLGSNYLSIEEIKYIVDF